LRMLRAAVVLAAIALAARTSYAFTTLINNPGAANIGVAADPSGNTVYFTEWNGGTLRRIHLTPTCTAVSTPVCVVDTVATGFSHPQDVALDLAHGAAYVTTRDDPGTTGALWRVDIATGVRTLITFNLNAPQQIALDVATDTAYVVGFGTGAGTGRLWRIQLASGSKTSILAGLGHPIGLAVTADRTRAYVTEQDTSSVASIDIALHARIGTVATGLTAPFFLTWADPGQMALYVVERSPNNDVVRVDLPTATRSTVITGLPAQSSGISLSTALNAAFLTSNDSVVRADLGALPLTAPVFLGVGNIPSTSIGGDGYATTLPAYFVHFKDSPFGGTLNIFGNFTAFRSLGASQYRVKVSSGGPPIAATPTWTSARFNTATGIYESATISPIAGTDRYLIPAEYPTNPERWYPSFLMLRWPSGTNGLYTFTVDLFDAAGNPLAPIAAGNLLTLRVDNDPPLVELVNVFQHGSATPVNACAIVTTGTSVFDVVITANDPNGHLLAYSASAIWGR
ncbi:MAG TPA: hypothetical protein VN605_01945, partial [Thermoanaerobaculia bacterium]|nr:hypothetical protein [Thermoanaerobaculia bacterium]